MKRVNLSEFHAESSVKGGEMPLHSVLRTYPVVKLVSFNNKRNFKELNPKSFF